jgi:hypothetical protein
VLNVTVCRSAKRESRCADDKPAGPLIIGTSAGNVRAGYGCEQRASPSRSLSVHTIIGTDALTVIKNFVTADGALVRYGTSRSN